MTSCFIPGEITLLGPLDIDPQMDDPKIRFMKGEGTTTVVQWSVGTQNLYTDWDSTMAQDLVFATAAGELLVLKLMSLSLVVEVDI